MKYLLFICVDDDLLTPEALAGVQRESASWVDEMDGRGVRQRGHALQATGNATTVRMREGEVVLADGPFAETKEYIGGFDIVECADLDEAIEVAGKHPVAKFGAIEVRPFREE
jgi:hypothetical protein